MASTMELSIVSVEETIYSGTVHYLSVTGEEGSLGVYPGHTPLLSGIRPGQVFVTDTNDDKNIFYVSGGLVEIQPDVVTILADTVVRAEDIDEVAARQARDHSQQLMSDKKPNDKDYQQAYIQLQEASAQLRALKDLHYYVRGNRIN